MNKHTYVFAGWAALMTVSVAFAVQSPNLGTASGPAIAQLTGRKGTVQFREDGVTLWLDAGSKQPFVNGTLLATGSQSEAKVAFLDGREIVLGESSQVVLTLGEEASDSIVTLLKGTIETKRTTKISTSNPAAAKTARRLIINSGNRSVALAKPEDAVKVDKVVGTSAPKIALMAGLPKLGAPIVVNSAPPALPVGKIATAAPEIAVARPNLNAAQAKIGSPTEQDAASESDVAEETSDLPEETPDLAAGDPTEPEDSSEPEAPTAPKRTPKPKAQAPLDIAPLRIVGPAAGGTRLWTTRSLASGSAVTLALASERDLALKDVKAEVEILRGSESIRSVPVARSGGQYTARLDLRDVQSGGVREGSLPSWTMSLRSRVAPRQGQEDRGAPALGKVQELRFASLADFPSGNVSVFLTRVAPQQGQGWIAQTGAVQPATAAAGIHLRNSGELPLLAPLLRGSGAFSLQARSAQPSTGTVIVRDGRVVARVSPDGGGASQAVRRALQGDVAFRGPSDSYLGTGAEVAKSQSTTDGWLTAERIVAYDRNTRPATIKTDLFKRRTEAWTVLAKSAVAVFTRQVTMVDPPGAAAWDVSSDINAAQRAMAGSSDGVASALGIPGRLIFLEGMTPSGEPRFLRLDHKTFNTLGVVTAASAGQSAFALNLNPRVKQKLAGVEKSSMTGLAIQSLILAEADAVVLAPEDGGAWTIAVAEGGKLRKLASASAPANVSDATSVHAWVLETLGVGGRVLTTQGRAGTTLAPPGYSPGRQAVAVSPAGRPVGIVELAALDGHLATIKLLTGADPSDALTPGTRLLWE